MMLCMSCQAKSNLCWILSAWKHMAPPDLWHQNHCTPETNSVMPATSRSTRKAFPWLVFWCLLAFCLTGRLSFCDFRLITALLCLSAPFPKVMGRELYHLPSFVLELLIIIPQGLWDWLCEEGDPHKGKWGETWRDSNVEQGPGWSLAAFYCFVFTAWYIRGEAGIFHGPSHPLCSHIIFVSTELWVCFSSISKYRDYTLHY